MRVYTAEELPQGSAAWHAARLGIPTASQFHRVVTEKKLAYSAGARPYIAELLAEKILGAPLAPYDPAGKWENAVLAPGRFFASFTERGTVLEREAVAYYELERGVDVERVGFIVTDDGDAGCSPDGLVGGSGGLEIKCRGAPMHMQCLLGMEQIAKQTQVQGCLMVTGREWWDVMAYNPAFPPVITRYGRDETMIAALERNLARFHAEMSKAERALDAMGPEGRVDDGLKALLAASLTEGVEPEPGEMSMDEIGQCRLDVYDARKVGVITLGREREIAEWLLSAQWTQAREAWAAIKAATEAASA